MDIFSNTQAPSTAINACISDGFALDSGLKITGAGVLLLGGEAFQWRPWAPTAAAEVGANGVTSSHGKLQNQKGQFHVDRGVWGVFDLVHPKPDLLILGTGKSILPLSPETRRHINELGIRIEVQDTRNAAAQFNLLATERGVHQVAAALVPIGWTEGQ